jgi:hypothetical protein
MLYARRRLIQFATNKCIVCTPHRILADHTIIRRPDCVLLSDRTNSFRHDMKDYLQLDDRLSILRREDQFRSWNSLDDQRLCIVCERKFNGRQVEIRCFPNGKHELHCPTEGCNSGPHQWVYPGTPLVSAIVDPDWSRTPNTEWARPLSGPIRFQGQENL